MFTSYYTLAIVLLLGTNVAHSSPGRTVMAASNRQSTPMFDPREETNNSGGILSFFLSPINYVSKMVSSSLGFPSSTQTKPETSVTVVEQRRATRRAPHFIPRRQPPGLPTFGPRVPIFNRGQAPRQYLRPNQIQKPKRKDGFWTGNFRSHYKMIEPNDDGTNPIVHAEEHKFTHPNTIPDHTSNTEHIITDTDGRPKRNHIIEESRPFSPPIRDSFAPPPAPVFQSSPQFTKPSPQLNNPSPQLNNPSPQLNTLFRQTSTNNEAQRIKKWNDWASVIHRENNSNDVIKKEVHRRLHNVNDVADALKIVVDALEFADDDSKIYMSRRNDEAKEYIVPGNRNTETDYLITPVSEDDLLHRIRSRNQQ